MRFVLHSFCIALEVRLKSIRGWGFFLIPILIFAFSRGVPAAEFAAPVQVGVVLPEAGAEEFWDLLRSHNGTVATFISTDKATVERNVAACHWDCGLILHDDFADRLSALEFDRIFTMQISQGSVAYPLVREAASACLVRLASPYIAESYLHDSGIAADADIVRLSKQIDADFAALDRVSVTLSVTDGERLKPIELAHNGARDVLCWLISVVLLVWLLMGATDHSRWLMTAAVKRMRPHRSVTILLLSRASADAIFAVITGSVAMMLQGMGLRGCTAVLTYVVLWTSITVMVARFPVVETVFPICLPFAVALSLVSSSALADASLIIPVFGEAVKWMPSAMFLRICSGDFSAVVLMTGMSTACFIISSLMDICVATRLSKREGN